MVLESELRDSNPWWQSVNGITQDPQIEDWENSVIKHDPQLRHEIGFQNNDPVDWLDEAYDEYRIYEYQRIQDIEIFYVKPTGINFDNTWSNGQDFDTWGPWHYTSTESFSNTVYISNTWNHLMDTVDENPGMAKYTWLF